MNIDPNCTPVQPQGNKITAIHEAFRSSERAMKLLQALKKITTQDWVIMEMCGGQTHSMMKYGIDQLLPPQIEVVHGPGCPVCVTPLELIDKAIAIAQRPEVIFTSYGDMLRVPGSHRDLFSVRAAGGDVRVVYSALDALRIAQENPEKEVVFFGIGFETTAPANGISILQAKRLGVHNYSVLVSQVRVPPAMEMILSAPTNRVQGFLAAGHVCAVMGTREYDPINARFQVPITVTGFEPVDLLAGVYETIAMLEAGTPQVRNAYSRSVTAEGNSAAQRMLDELFEPCDRNWRGIGSIPNSGWKLRPAFAAYDAELKFDATDIRAEESKICIAGQILLGLQKPTDCPAFGTVCTPLHPLGATMVSGEGACAAYHKYRRTA